MARKRKKLTKKQREKRRRILWGTLLVSVAFFIGMLVGDSAIEVGSIRASINQWTTEVQQWFTQNNRPSSAEEVSEANIHFFDVNQGSATLLQSDDTNILIDTGRFDDSEQQIIHYLDQYIGLGETIDLLIFTHNDADHIGHGDLVLDYFNVEEVWMNGMDHTTVTYEDVLDATLESDAEYKEPKAGEEHEVGPFWVEVLHPLPNEVMRDQNEESIVTRITVNDISFMGTGDASSDIEDRIIQENRELTSEILLVGHHGSRYSTSEEWLHTVDPLVSVYQAGEENMYGHPHEEVLSRIENRDISLFGTPEHGTISILINEDGQLIVETER